LKSTLVGGVLFLLPLIVMIVIVEKAVQLATRVFAPLGPVLGDRPILGVSVATIGSLIALLLLCLVAGVFARTVIAQRFIARLEDAVLSRIPAYNFLKSTAEGVAGIESDASMKPVVVRLDDNLVIGLMTEQHEGQDLVAVYLPGAPTPISGSVIYVERERVTLIEATTVEIFAAMKQIGRDSLDMITGTPADAAGG
jgi:uncharacterized membrane protein